MGAFASKPEKKSKAVKTSKILDSAVIKQAEVGACKALLDFCKYENCKEKELKRCKKMIKEKKIKENNH